MSVGVRWRAGVLVLTSVAVATGSVTIWPVVSVLVVAASITFVVSPTTTTIAAMSITVASVRVATVVITVTVVTAAVVDIDAARPNAKTDSRGGCG